MLNLLLKTNKILKISVQIKIILFITFVQVFTLAKAADFQTVYNSAKENSVELKLFESYLDESKAELGIANSAFFPKVGIEARNERFKSDLEDHNKNSSNIYVEWNVFSGLKDIKAQESKKSDLLISEMKKERFNLNFEGMAKAKYAKAYALQEKVDSYKKIIESNLKNLETVKRQRQSGRLSEADFLEFQLFDAKLKQDLVRLELEAATKLSELKLFSGLNNIEKLSTKLIAKAVKLDPGQVNLLLLGEKSLLNESRLRVESLEALKSETNGSFLPAVHIKASHGSTGFRDAIKDPETVVSVNAKWELFSGLESLSQRKKAIAKLSQAQIQYKNDQLSSVSHAEQLLKQLKNIIDRLKFEEENQKSVEKFLKTVEAEYRRGVKSSSDLKSALELILATGLNKADLRSDYFASRAELQNLIGKPLDEKAE